jgi:hypothetical protein
MAALILVGPVAAASAEPTLPQRYLAIYLKINEAEHLEAKGDYRGSLEDFEDCQAKLEQIRALDPRWESALVGHRLNDCRAKIAEMQAKATAPAADKNAAPVPAAPPYFASMPGAKSGKKNTYPWKENIVCTLFWIGEGSNTTSAWNEKWKANNNGDDSPHERNGYASGKHASSVNPFYVALPFNDLAFPDKARKWLPPGWQQAVKDGKRISACKDRWVMIKNKNGDICYAQWEDAGPVRQDDAEYVFGDARPRGGTGIDMSPAVGEYLSVDRGKNLVSWRFVDDEDVRPGPWLKLDEQAVIFTALHQGNR